jgi:importin subunit beta-1
LFQDCLTTVQQVIVATLDRLETTIAVQVSIHKKEGEISDAITLTIISLLQNQIIGVDDSNAHAELQSNLLSVLTVCIHFTHLCSSSTLINFYIPQSCIRKLSTGVSVVSDRVMTVLLQMLSTASKQSSITEDVFLAVGSLTAALDSDFSRYVEPFARHLYSALQNPDEHQVGDILSEK